MEATWKTNLNQKLDQMFRFFIPEEYYSEPESLRQAKISISFYLFNFLSFTLFSVNGIFFNFLPHFYSTFLIGMVCLSAAFLFRARVNPDNCANFFGVNVSVYMFYMIHSSGGMQTSAAISTILTPIYILLLTNKLKTGFSWFLISLSIYILSNKYNSEIIKIIEVAPSDPSGIYYFSTIMGFFTNLFVLVVIFEYEKNRAISALKGINKDLKNTQEQLVQKEKLASLGELTAGIAHEIQNPLNFVNNFSELSIELADELKEEFEKENFDKELIKELAADLVQNQEKINFHGKRASNIVKGMLDHSRVSTGEKKLINLNELTEEYLRLSFHGMRAKDKTFNADFKAHLDSDLPEIFGVPQDLGRVFLNLINNSFYSVFEKSKKLGVFYKPMVELTTQKNKKEVIITIADNGEGIPEAIRHKIFQPFFTTKPTGEGTGLGLSLSYDIITKMHGGNMEVDTVDGEYCKFIIRLPAN
ncbi:MAG: GHKL domain-containing protein [Bacteroidetes bacterium]|nr:GHKL domain-containing protein [Bacteroidota bacterium]